MIADEDRRRILKLAAEHGWTPAQVDAAPALLAAVLLALADGD